ncbi:AzlC family ABC transporter permease [Effusibacillus pohliae]|uniref:AzlC family ABC transporter permease n=1 Tax=Effusibacillus pohliae TaxID=232270 RepID=UPI002ADE36D2|nr:AzlC family ABC transporter permease [Effusibacillus pohliae]
MSMEGAASQAGERLTFRDGAKAGIPVAIGYIPIAVTFGLLAKSAGIPDSIGVLMSLLVFAGASQFVGVNLLAVGVSHWEIVLTTLILNLRHFLMTASLSRRIAPGTSKKWMALLSYGVTDETFSVASFRREQNLSPSFVLGLNLIAFLAWNAGTWIGLFLGAGLPQSLQASMGIALYAMFIGLLAPSLKKSRPMLVIALLAAAIHSCLKWVPLFKGLSAGWGIMIATVLAATVGAMLFPEEASA